MEATDFISIRDASKWASTYLQKKVTPSNISYLVQYGRIKKFEENSSVMISKAELKEYYQNYHSNKREEWTEILGEDLNWALSFDQYREAETTKHVHRLHPYKGKFIPQLVEYFLDTHTDKFKDKVFFEAGDIVLDPFVGSGTTLVQANELGIHAVGIDISAFNIMMAACKINEYNLGLVQAEFDKITAMLSQNPDTLKSIAFEEKLLQALSGFNSKYFPSPEYKRQIRTGEIDEKAYAFPKEAEFLPQYQALIEEYGIDLLTDSHQGFIDKWFIAQIKKELEMVSRYIKSIADANTKRIVALTLSRTMRSCRATTHADLATLNEPVTTTYYCAKHGKICKPLFSILKWWKTYSKDTIKRLKQFNKLRTNTKQVGITGDSRNIDIIEKVNNIDPQFAKLIQENKIKGIFTSPPYVGMIDYHEQHAYAYELFGFERKDEMEIGPLYKGQGKEAQNSYVEGISQVLINAKPYLKEDYDVFLVSNDKYNLYPEIAKRAGMKIVNQFKRPVLNRTEKDKGAYSEIIFHLKQDKTGSKA